MPEGRCDLILLGWTAFVGFNLISDFLWSSSTQKSGDGSGVSTAGPASLAATTAELYRGDYRLELKNGSAIETGSLRLMLASQQTSVTSVQMSAITMVLLRPSRRKTFTAAQADLRLTGVEFSDAGKVTATGAADTSHFATFSSTPCRLNAALQLSSGSPDAGGTAGGVAEGTAGGGKASSTLAGEVVAPDCGFSVVFQADAVNVPHLTQKVVHYSIWANVLTIIQIRCYLMQMRHTEEGPSAAKVSVVCIAMQALMDAYDSFLHLCLGLASQYMFNTIAVVSLFKFILFSLLEARYLLTIWRQRRHEAFTQGWDVVRRELSWLYSRFYGVLILGLIVIYNNLEHLDTIVLVFQAYWVPQILHDAWQGSRSAVRPAFFCEISLTRTLLMLYLWGCPNGIFSGDLYPRLPGSPSLMFCILVVVLQVIQITVMALQRRLGPRWFVPWICMPWAYNYHRGIRIEPGTDCVICMSEIDPEDAHRVVTPCSHNFHRACLQQWMDVKMECPTCRMTLPPIQ
mmetsp:Transcript_20243/g.40988  ORF Transcript_20243/g.40988 Transcript_20243/m.40988 type:complete len:515 (-) Transcript_20243:159-1703(-)